MKKWSEIKKEKQLKNLLSITQDLNNDELEVIVTVAEGLQTGRKVYGPIDVYKDIRDWHQEALEEARDLAVYLSAAILRLKRERGSKETWVCGKCGKVLEDGPGLCSDSECGYTTTIYKRKNVRREDDK